MNRPLDRLKYKRNKKLKYKIQSFNINDILFINLFVKCIFWQIQNKKRIKIYKGKKTTFDKFYEQKNLGL